MGRGMGMVMGIIIGRDRDSDNTDRLMGIGIDDRKRIGDRDGLGWG